MELLITKINKIKTRITHCHSTGSDYVFIHKILKPLCNLLVIENQYHKITIKIINAVLEETDFEKEYILYQY